MSFPYLLCRLRRGGVAVFNETNAAIRFIAVTRQLFQGFFIRYEVYHFMETGSKICELRQQADQIARRTAASLWPASSTGAPRAGRVVRHKGVGRTLPQCFIQPIGLLFIFAGNQDALTVSPAAGPNHTSASMALKSSLALSDSITKKVAFSWQVISINDSGAHCATVRLRRQ